MSRRSRRRDGSTIARARALHPVLASVRLSPLRPSLNLMDGRFFHFDPPARSLSARPFHSQVVLRNRSRPHVDRMAFLRRFPSQTKAVIAFRSPRRVSVCVRRQERREVLHALGRSGRGAGYRRHRAKYRWTRDSLISCRS